MSHEERIQNIFDMFDELPASARNHVAIELVSLSARKIVNNIEHHRKELSQLEASHKSLISSVSTIQNDPSVIGKSVNDHLHVHGRVGSDYGVKFHSDQVNDMIDAGDRAPTV